jgi:hypothetical protein
MCPKQGFERGNIAVAYLLNDLLVVLPTEIRHPDHLGLSSPSVRITR